MRCWIWLALSLYLAAPCLAADNLSPARQAELENLLTHDCGSCHGLKMRGGLGPPLLPESLTSQSTDYLSTVILYGRPGSAMPPWRHLLTEEEARWIAARLVEGAGI